MLLNKTTFSLHYDYKKQVEKFLEDFSMKVKIFGIRFRDDRHKNQNSLIVLGITPNQRLEVIMNLSGIRLEAKDNTQNALSDTEINTIERVCEIFSEMSAGKISQTSHLEKGWMENKDNRSAISYQDAFTLKFE